jgi:hypothetical protein
MVARLDELPGNVEVMIDNTKGKLEVGVCGVFVHIYISRTEETYAMEEGRLSNRHKAILK